MSTPASGAGAGAANRAGSPQAWGFEAGAQEALNAAEGGSHNDNSRQQAEVQQPAAQDAAPAAPAQPIPHVPSTPGELAALAKDRAARQRLLDIVQESSNNQDNTRFMQKVADRLQRVGVTFPSVEVRWQGLTAEVDVPDGGNQLTTVATALVDMLKGAAAPLVACGGTNPGLKRRVILNNVSGVLRPGRMTLLLGPPGSGKTTLMKALAGQLAATSPDMRITDGAITYNGLVPGRDFVVERAATYVSQIDTHIAQMTVAETLSFASESMGTGMLKELFEEVRSREQKQGITPDAALEASFAATQADPHGNIIVEYMARLLGIDHVLDTVVGDDLLKGISGGQKRRVTVGEMAVGLMQVMFLDEISNGLDSSATLAIAKALRNISIFTDATLLVSLLQPAPEVCDCFDDFMIMSHGRIVFHGPREEVVPFFSSLGFSVPITITTADFLQEVTNQSDQQRYWSREGEQWQWMPPLRLKEAFEESDMGQEQAERLKSPPYSHPMQHMVLHNTMYALSFRRMLQCTFQRELLLTHRSRNVVMTTILSTVMGAFLASTTFLQLGKSTFLDASMFLSIAFFSLANFVMGGFNFVPIFCKRLPIFFKQRNHHFYTGTAYAISATVMRVPEAVIGVVIFSIMVYFSSGFTMDVGLFFTFWLGLFSCSCLSSSMFLFFGALTRNDTMAQGGGAVAFMVMIAVSGFVIARSSIPGWWIWLYWCTPMSYIIRAIAVNEMTSSEWDASSVPFGGAPGTPLGEFALQYRGIYVDKMWIWIGIGAEFAFTFLFVVLTAICLNTLPPPAGKRPPPPHDGADEFTEEELKPIKKSQSSGLELSHAPTPAVSITMPTAPHLSKPEAAGVTGPAGLLHKGQVAPEPDGTASADSLPFQPVTLVFKDVCYFVPRPKGEGELQLLNSVSGSFRPGVLTALMGASGAGKTTLMDVLADRKTAGRTTGEQLINGHPKHMDSFARVMGYVEQFDVHMPQATVLESLIFSARLRLKGSSGMSQSEILKVVWAMMDVVELRPLEGAVVGNPGSGLSTEARKRLTIAVELVASPSLVFMDEPTSGLDARAASVVMRAVRNTVRTGRTVVCTIHQPNRQIFEAFDELLLLKPGGRTIFHGPLGDGASNLVSYFESIPNVAKYEPRLNPANWMLDVSNTSVEKQMGVDFAEIWNNSQQARSTSAVIERCCTPAAAGDAEAPITDLERAAFTPIVAEEGGLTPQMEFKLLVTRALQMHWRNPSYNLLRIMLAVGLGLFLGTLYWDAGSERTTLLGILNIMGAQFVSTIFMGVANCLIVMPIVFSDRTVFYREKASRMYNPVLFSMAQGAAELPFLVVQAVLYSIILYFTIHFQFTAAKFFWFLVIMFLNLAFFTYLGICCMNVMALPSMATSVSSLLIMMWNLFCGFLQAKNDIRKWWIWAYYCNPATWVIYGLVVTQLGDIDDEYIDVGQGKMMSVSQYIEDSYSYKYSFRWGCIIILVLLLVMLRVGSTLGLRYFNFQQR